MSYSQNNEEAVLLDYFGAKADGMLLEIGAFHPTRLSNTRALLERGWSGMLCDMSPFSLGQLVRAYEGNERVRVVGGAITVEAAGPASVWLVAPDESRGRDGAVSTTEAWHRDKWAGQGHVPYVCGTISLNEIYAMLPSKVDMVSIDTEGTSMTLAMAFEWERFAVDAVVVEHDGSDALIGRLSGTHEVAEVNGENVVMVRSR
jgi:hypothetical protein